MPESAPASDWIVLKFGGTSVADAQKIRRAAGRALNAAKQGFQVVVVASGRSGWSAIAFSAASRARSSQEASRSKL